MGAQDEAGSDSPRTAGGKIDEPATEGAPPPSAAGGPASAGRVGTLGCLMTVAGFFSGAMIAVLIAKVRGAMIHCDPGPELPACNWQQFAGVGGMIGAISLPALVLWRLRMPRWGRRGGQSESNGRDL